MTGDSVDTKPFETDDKNLAALLRAKDVPQSGHRAELSGDPFRPHIYFQFADYSSVCQQIKDAALLGGIQVNYRRFIAEQIAVMDQIFEYRRREGEVPPFMTRKPYKRE